MRVTIGELRFDDTLVVYTKDLDTSEIFVAKGEVYNDGRLIMGADSAVKEEAMRDWVTLLYFPFSSNGGWYKLHKQCEKEMQDVRLLWKCMYIVDVYDGVQAHLYGYGSTPESALKETQEQYTELGKRYLVEEEEENESNEE